MYSYKKTITIIRIIYSYIYKVYFLVLLIFVYTIRRIFRIFKFLNFTNFVKKGENSIVLATIAGKLPLCLIYLLKIRKCFAKKLLRKSSFSHLDDCTLKTLFKFCLTLIFLSCKI